MDQDEDEDEDSGGAMEESDEWLPPGWTVEVRMRKNGRRDKVMVEKAIAEVLAPEWVKKTRRTTNGDTVGSVLYHINPISGYTFRSVKDVDGYIESGQIGRQDKDSTSVTVKPTLSVNMSQSSDLDMIANDQQTPRPASSGECVVGTKLTSSVLSRTGISDQKERNVCLAQSTLVPGCTNVVVQRTQLQENSETKNGTEKSHDQHHRSKNKHKKDVNLPRRTSKRLAGIKVDPVPELKTRRSRRRAAIKQSGEEENIANVEKSPNSLPDGPEKQFNAPEVGTEIECKSEKHAEKTLEGKNHEDCFSFSPLKNNTTVEECVRVLENGDDAKLDYTFDYPLTELLKDPCIAFAYQTLTGVTFDITKDSQTSSVLKNSQNCNTSDVAAGVGVGNSKRSNDGLVGDNEFSSPKNLAFPQEYSGDAKTDGKVKKENAGGPSSEEAQDTKWMDPCIEFAIKTLTGTTPLDSDQNPKNRLQQQRISCTEQRGEKGLSSVNLDNIYQSDYQCSQYFGTQKPMFKQSFVDPSLQHTRNIGIGNSTGARLSHW
ncbi:hypothetical protein Fmac_015872 [Flemingia macrophylla]|uniref:MBD domain-containing protein n=1 Tax=Flemingia macrophylla TaxID=520843 RepID=A0ABD1MFT1_9FABA